MDITATALKRIRELKQQQGIPDATGVRLSLGAAGISLRWAPSGPRATDMILAKPGVAVFVEAGAYVRLSDYELDVQGVNGSRKFVVRHRRVEKRRDGGKNHEVSKRRR